MFAANSESAIDAIEVYELLPKIQSTTVNHPKRPPTPSFVTKSYSVPIKPPDTSNSKAPDTPDTSNSKAPDTRLEREDFDLLVRNQYLIGRKLKSIINKLVCVRFLLFVILFGSIAIITFLAILIYKYMI